ncbi:MAG: hypothetical protein M1833_000365 [Piccolia ochrophora]|nr:MAG: hypothetical protein M1833_000365 [Piccolia ochrophora]
MHETTSRSDRTLIYDILRYQELIGLSPFSSPLFGLGDGLQDKLLAPQVRWSSATTEPLQPDAAGTTKGPASPANQIKYTSESYPSIKRDARFAELTDEHVVYFKDLLGAESAVIDGITADASDDLEAFNSDWMRKYRGHTRLVLRPKTTEEVSKILKYCNDRMLAVVPQGGNSGLVGGSVPVFDEIVVSTSRMNNIRSFDEVSGSLVVDAGCILEVVDQYLAERQHLFPLDLGAKGSCQIGGNVATNAGGLRLLRYGSLHGNVLGLEAVLPDGTIVDDLSTLRKNNTGYDLKHLFIGGEGTIGLITGVSILCPQRPKATNVAFFGLQSFEKVRTAYREAKGQLSEILSAFELMDGQSQDLVHKVTSKKRPLEGQYPFYCLIETSGSNKEHDDAKLEAFLEHVMSLEIVEDGVLAQDTTQASSLWSWREGIPEVLGHWGGVYKYDLSIPLPSLYALVEDTRERLSRANLLGDDPALPVVDVVGYGHMGDCNLHLNVATRGFDKRVEEELEPFVYEWVKEKHGSISAEHGLGLAKKAFVGYSRSDTMLRLMRDLKQLYDPSLGIPLARLSSVTGADGLRSPDGHVFQVEYALEAVKRGTCAVGVKGKDLVVLGCEKRSAMKLQDTRITPSKIGLIDTHVCLAFAGLNADARILVDKARLEAQSHRLTVEDPVTIEYITKYVAGVQQRYTQSGGVRPFGISTLIVGFDKGDKVPRLKANAIGRSSKTVREFLERNHKDDMDREETIKLTVKSLLEVVQTGAKNIEIAIMAPGKTIEMLPVEDIESYVKNIEAEKQEEAAKKKTGRTPGTGTAAILTRTGGDGSET